MSERKIVDIPVIRLAGEPYQQTIDNKDGKTVTIDCSESLNKLAQGTDYYEVLPDRIDTVLENALVPLREGGFHGVDAKLKHGETLDFDDSYSIGTFVVMALNRAVREAVLIKTPVPGYDAADPQSSAEDQTHLLQATSLLSSMSAKEGYVGLTAEEIAGVVAATISLDTVVRTKSAESVLSLGGMGGDKGYQIHNQASKLFSLSTLSSLILASDGNTHKHHSYPNTSKVAGQSAIEAFGARSDFHSAEAYEELFASTGLMMSSCHNTRTLHTLSHKLKGETINHIIGPLAFTIAPGSEVHGFIGVNEKIYPATAIRALKELSDRDFQLYGDSVAFCGTDLTTTNKSLFSETQYYQSIELRDHIMLDEVAPPPYRTLASFLRNGRETGTFELDPEDFYTRHELQDMNIDSLLVKNDVDSILSANRDALSGADLTKSRYLAMTAGLGIFTRKYLGKEDSLNSENHRVNRSYLRLAVAEALELIQSGQASQKLEDYVTATRELAGK